MATETTGHHQAAPVAFPMYHKAACWCRFRNSSSYHSLMPSVVLSCVVLIAGRGCCRMPFAGSVHLLRVRDLGGGKSRRSGPVLLLLLHEAKVSCGLTLAGSSPTRVLDQIRCFRKKGGQCSTRGPHLAAVDLA